MNNKLALVVAVMLGVLSIAGIQIYISQIKARIAQGEELLEVITAAREINQGEKISEQDIVRTTLPVKLIRRLGNTHIRDKKVIVNSVAQTAIATNQVIQFHHVTEPRSASGGLDLTGGYRAVTVKVNPVTGLAGMLRPGDFVDVICAVEGDKLVIAGQKVKQITSLMLPKVKVLACDGVTDRATQERRFGYATVTLRVEPAQATRLVHAQAFGEICLSLIKDEEPRSQKLYPVVAESLLKDAVRELK